MAGVRRGRERGRERGKTNARSAGRSDAGAALMLTFPLLLRPATRASNTVDFTERAVVSKILVKESVNETHQTGPGCCKSNNKSA